MTNDGYAVARAGIARALVVYGLLPAFGLHRASVTNAFNLADDILEPFRPCVDALAAARAKKRKQTDDLSIDARRAMAGVPFASRIVALGALLIGESRQPARASPLTADTIFCTSPANKGYFI